MKKQMPGETECESHISLTLESKHLAMRIKLPMIYLFVHLTGFFGDV